MSGCCLLTIVLFPAAPELGHILESLALGLRNELPDEEGCDDADDAVETVGEPVSEVVTFGQVHVEHWHERRADNEVGYPLEGHCYSYGTTTNGIGEYLGNEHPSDRTP